MKTFRLTRQQKNVAKIATMCVIGCYLLAFAAVDPLAALSTLTIGVGIVAGASLGGSNQQTDAEIIAASQVLRDEWQTLKAKERIRPLSAAELNQCDYLEREMDKFQLEHEDVLSKSQGRTVPPSAGTPLGQGGGRRERDYVDDPSRLRFRNVATGQIMAGLKHGERIYQGERPCEVGDMLTSILTRRYDHLDRDGESFARQALGESTIASGGALLGGHTLSSMVIDSLLPAAVLVRAGGQVIPMDTASLQVARITGHPTAHWRGEGQSIDSSQPTFGTYLVRPYFLGITYAINMEMIEDIDNTPRLLEAMNRAKMASEVDGVGLRGMGVGATPTGIRGTRGIQTMPSVGTPADYSVPTGAVRRILDSNFQGDVSSLAWVRSPNIGEAYDGLVDSTGQPLQPTPWASKLQVFHTTTIPDTLGSGGNESEMYFGDFSQVAIFVRRGVTIELLREGLLANAVDGDENLISEFKYAIRCSMRVDVLCLRPDHFVFADGVTS